MLLNEAFYLCLDAEDGDIPDITREDIEEVLELLDKSKSARAVSIFVNLVLDYERLQDENEFLKRGITQASERTVN